MKKTKMKRGRGGLIAFLAAGVLMLNVVPARAEEGPWWEPIIPIIPVLYDIVKDLVDGDAEGAGGGTVSDSIPCWSQSQRNNDFRYIDCGRCKTKKGKAIGVNSRCSVIR